jgi:hypothetical protein
MIIIHWGLNLLVGRILQPDFHHHIYPFNLKRLCGKECARAKKHKGSRLADYFVEDDFCISSINRDPVRSNSLLIVTRKGDYYLMGEEGRFWQVCVQRETGLLR